MPSLTHVLLSSWLIASGADATSTFVALHRGAREQNPLMLNSPWVIAGAKVGSGTLSCVWAQKWEKKAPQNRAMGCGGGNRRVYLRHHQQHQRRA
jgi:hypothetical protein